MANAKISALPSGSPPQSSDAFVVARSGANYQLTYANLAIPSLLSPTAVKTGAYNAAVGDLIPCDISGGSFTVTLPTAPADKSQIVVEVVKRVTTGAPTYVTVACGGSDVLFIASGATSGIIGRGSVVFQYNASGAIWYAPGTGDLLPTGWEFGYDQITGNVNISSTTAPGTTIITCAAHVFDGSPVECEVGSVFVQTGSGGQVQLWLTEGGSQLNLLTQHSGIVSSYVPIHGNALRFTPTAGSHTYVITGQVPSGTGIFNATAGSPGFARFTKV